MKINSNIYLNDVENYSLPKLDFKKLYKESNAILDRRKKKHSIKNILKEEDKNLSVILQPELKTDFDLETNMFAAYPQSNIPFSNSLSWIGM